MVGQMHGAPTSDGDQRTAAPAETVHELFERQVARTPGAVAAECGSRSITYSELNARANRLAHLLRRRGVGPDVLVGLLVNRSLEMLVGLLGILKAGGAYVPLDPDYPADRVAYILDDAAAALLVADRQAAGGHLSRRDGTVWLDAEDSELGGEPREDPPAVNSPSDLAYVIYTSGSTGRPKGVQIPHRAFVNFLRSMQRTPGMTAVDVIAAVTTISFDIAGLELFLPLLVGARTIIVPRDEAADGRRLSALLQQKSVTLMQATPATWRMLVDAGWMGSPDLRILCGGEAMPRELANRLLERSGALWNMYGPTETTVWSTLARVPGDGPIPLGAPIDNTWLHIVDEQLQPVPPGVEGELCIGGDGVARGYLNRPDLTAERFIPDTLSPSPGGRLYRTGDLARRLEDGTLLFGGRRDHQVKIRGFRIELGEIENVLLQDPQVGQAAVVTPENARGEKQLVACVVGRPDTAGVDPKAVRDRLRGVLPGYMIPSRVIALPELPLTPNGKIDRKTLVQMTPPETAEVAPARDEVEARLLRLWEEVLGTSPISVDADFFDLGGDSLQAAALFAGIAREFRRDLPVTALLHDSTVERLAGVLRNGERSATWTSLVPFRTSGKKRPFFFVHGGAGTVLFMRELAANLDRERPVYGLQSEGHDGRGLVHDTVEEMAALYLREIRSVQPEGPYNVGGYCFGGTVAFEIARQLQEQGQEASFVGLVNAPCPAAGPDIAGPEVEEPKPVEQAGSRIEKAVRRLASVRRASGLERVRMLGRVVGDAARWRWELLRSRRIGSRILNLGPRALLALGGRLPKAWRPAYILAMTERAERRYHPRPYDGTLVVIRGSGLYRDPALGWGSLASGVHACAIDGAHRLRRDLITPGLVPLLAAELGRRLDEADMKTAGRTWRDAPAGRSGALTKNASAA